ncbi:MAG: geranylgeranyl reductase family protein [Methanosphaera sp.]|nr:geranylgeranyl reductase family protein [Methanosphaera sp.]
MTDYDVIVVGAGPVGSTYAYHMANKGYDVAIFDMKNRIGEPLQCAGIVSTNITLTEQVPEEIIYNKVKGAKIYSPNKTLLHVKKDETVAYVLDRVYYDKHLFQRALDAGATPYLSSRVLDVDIENTSIKTVDNTYTSKIIAVAAGPVSSTSKKMNPDIMDESFTAIQYTIDTKKQDIQNVVLEVHNELLPGFLWKIPVTATKQRLGLFTDASYKTADIVLKNAMDDEDIILEKHTGLIPKYNKNKKIVYNNTLLIGDSASQIKPTTGGGLIVGSNMARLASDKSDLMLAKNDNKYLLEYETEYHKRYDNEFKAQQNVQSIIRELSDDDFDYMFEQLQEHNVDKMISEYGDMDTQTPLLKQLVKSGIIFKLLPKIGVRRLKNIWKSL